MSDEITISESNGLIKVDFHVERLDAAAAVKIKSQLDDLSRENVETVVIDLEPLRFIDSSGVGVLLGIYRRFPSKGLDARLVNVSKSVRSVLELLRLHRIFMIE